MKKNIFTQVLLSTLLFLNSVASQDTCFTTALTAGYVFKTDCNFKEIYGHGITDILTADFGYKIYKPWAIGAKLSYFRAKGLTSFLKQPTFLQELPFTVYAKRNHYLGCGFDVYGSLGGGVIFVKESSYLGCSKNTKGIGELEVGSNYNFYKDFSVCLAFRILFPSECISYQKAQIGGYDLRAGLEFAF